VPPNVTDTLDVHAHHDSEVADAVHVVLVEDHPVFRFALQAMLQDAGCVIDAVCADAAEVLEQLRDLPGSPLVLTDLALPDSSGTDVCRRILELRPDLRVIAMSAHCEPQLVYDLVQQGACGFISKFAVPAEILRLVRHAAYGGVVFDVAASTSLKQAISQQHSGPLSAREVEILELLDRGLSTQAIAARLHLAAATVKTHISRASAKLGTVERAATVAEARRRGLLRTSRVS
jgi:two-component system nitrate/nitrite response regulator NarL